MLNSQPLGSYSPSQLVQDARRHGVQVRPPDVMHSDLDCTLEDLPHRPAVRLGLRMVIGLRWASAELSSRHAPVRSSTAPGTWPAGAASSSTRSACWPVPMRC
ncbi:DNA polymerase III alpha subunit [Variovorax guangxiensis]|nr:DNA polymerase III alpha subunit [Variovorax guangxiensis]